MGCTAKSEACERAQGGGVWGSGPSPRARQEVDRQLVMCEMVCPRDKVGVDFPGLLFCKRADYMCFNSFKSLGCPDFFKPVSRGETAPQ